MPCTYKSLEDDEIKILPLHFGYSVRCILVISLWWGSLLPRIHQVSSALCMAMALVSACLSILARTTHRCIQRVGVLHAWSSVAPSAGTVTLGLSRDSRTCVCLLWMRFPTM